MPRVITPFICYAPPLSNRKAEPSAWADNLGHLEGLLDISNIAHPTCVQPMVVQLGYGWKPGDDQVESIY